MSFQLWSQETVTDEKNSAASCLFRLNYRQTGGRNQPLQYKKIGGALDGACSIDFSDPEEAGPYVWLEFPTGVSWAPERLEVNGRKGRRAVCVFAQDRFHYRVYDLDGSSEIEEEAERKDGESDTIMRD